MLSLRADGLFTTARKPERRPMRTPAAPLVMASAYGLRFCGMSTLERV